MKPRKVALIYSRKHCAGAACLSSPAARERHASIGRCLFAKG